MTERNPNPAPRGSAAYQTFRLLQAASGAERFRWVPKRGWTIVYRSIVTGELREEPQGDRSVEEALRDLVTKELIEFERHARDEGARELQQLRLQGETL